MQENISVSNEEETGKIQAVEILKKMGYKYISKNESKLLRNNILNEVLFKEILIKKLNEINSYKYGELTYKFSPNTIRQAVNDLNMDLSTGMININEKIYDMLTIGKSYTEKMKDGSTRSFNIKYIDFDNPENNDFYVTDEFSVLRINGRSIIKLDIVLFVNGIPLAVIENKSDRFSLIQGITQTIMNQENEYIPQLFKFIQIIMCSNQNETKYATCGTPAKSWLTWKEEHTDEQNKLLKKIINNRPITKQDRDIVSLFSKDRFLELIKDFIIFESGIKKICRYPQYFAVKETMERIKKENKGGIIWHTQGSGKSIIMVYIAKKIMQDKEIENPQVVIVSDRKDIDNQIHKIFNKVGIFAKNASTGKELLELIENKNSKVITTILNKFETVINSGVRVQSNNTFILINEVHRTNYNSIIEKMQNIFERAIYILFTGTPIMKKDIEAFKKFGGLIHKYSLDNALQDNAIVPLIYERRIINENINKENLPDMRFELIAKDIANHYNETLKETNFNAIFICNKNIEAVKYYNIFKSKFPDLKVAIVISEPKNENKEEENTKDIIREFYINLISNYKNMQEYERITKLKFINQEIDILIVVDKFLTGFDAPRASTLYLDKNLKGHKLLQSIARINRICDGKDHGYIIDYRGLLGEIDKTLTIYRDTELEEFEKEDINNMVYYIDNEINRLLKIYDELKNIFKKVKNEKVLGDYEKILENGKIRIEFYKKFCKFENIFEIIINSDNIDYKIGKEKIIELTKSLVLYKNILERIKQKYPETLNYNEQKIKKILDNPIIKKEIKDVSQDLKEEKYQIDYPTNISTENSKAFYYVIYNILVRKRKNKIDIQELGNITLTIQKKIESKVKIDWHKNRDIYNELAQFIEDTIYSYKVRKNINLSFEDIDLIIEEIMKVALIKY